MSKITTKTIINFLPLDPSFKLDLLEKYDTLSREEQLRISDLVWQTFDNLYELKIKENFDKAIVEAEKSAKQPSQSFYGEVVKKTDEEIKSQLLSAGESVDLSKARKSMEQIVREINAAKKQLPNAPKAN